MAHRIRLHGPWQTSITGTPDRQTTLFDRIQIPQSWERHNSVGAQRSSVTLEPLSNTPTLVLTRPFGCPTGLATSQKVWLTFHSNLLAATVRLNENRIGQIEPGDCLCRIEITERLMARNCLQLEIYQSPFREKGMEVSSVWGELISVHLEIE